MIALPSRSDKHDEGYVLLWVIYSFLLFYIIAISFSESSFLEELISINYRQAAQAFEMADGGILVGVEEIYSILERDCSHSQDIPEELTLSKQRWAFNEYGKEIEFYLENPKCIYLDDNECRFQLSSRGVSLPAQRNLQAEVQVEFLDIYKIEYDAGGEAFTVFERREFLYPAKIISLQYDYEDE